MEFAVRAYRRMLGKLFLIQVALLMAAVVVLALLLGTDYILAALYGGMVTKSQH